MITPVWIIGFTGHRPSDELGRTKAELFKLEPTIAAQLQKLAKLAEECGGRADLLCGLAAGADLLAARAAWNQKMAVHVILPQPEEIFLKHDGHAHDLSSLCPFQGGLHRPPNAVFGSQKPHTESCADHFPRIHHLRPRIPGE